MADRFDVKGSIVALITPFHEDGSINFEKLEELLEFHIANKTDGILVLGTTSESPTFTCEEDFEIVKRSVEVCKGRIPLIVNAGSNEVETAEVAHLQKDVGYYVSQDDEAGGIVGALGAAFADSDSLACAAG